MAASSPPRSPILIIDSDDDLGDDIQSSFGDSPLKRKRPGESSPTEKRSRQQDRHASLAAERLSVLKQILKERFQHNAFRYEQQAAILSVMDGNNTLVVFPTGAGKSLCFQIPALAFEQLDKDCRRGKHGITVVISPLLALIKDQVDSLKRKGISARALDSTQTAEEHLETYRALSAGELKILYCNPEKLNTKGFVKRLKRVPGGVRLVAVDEAHCVSEWGHSFRPDYLKVARFVKQVAAERVICLTATATTTVAEGIREAFDIEAESVFQLSPYRPNFQLHVENTDRYEEKVWKALKYVQYNPGSTVIYASFVKQVEDITRRLKSAGHKAEAFYSKLSTEQKRDVQEGFMAGEIRIICATIAFGLGIDKADIRNIIQLGMPRSVEEYSQQIGRAGRDGKPAKCMLYISPSDYTQRKNLETGGFPSQNAIRDLLRDIFEVRCNGMEVGGIFTVNQHEQVNNSYNKYKRIDAWTIEYIYAALELRFGLLHAISRKESPGQMRDDSKSYLEQYGFNAKFRLMRLAPRDVKVSELADDVWAEMKNRLDERLWRATQLMQLVSSKRCLAYGLAEHFAASLPDGAKKCLSCTFCHSSAQAVISLPKNFEQDALTYSQLITRRPKNAVWNYSPTAGTEIESDDSSDGDARDGHAAVS